MSHNEELYNYFVRCEDEATRTIRAKVIDIDDESLAVCKMIDELERRGMVEVPIDENTDKFLHIVYNAWQDAKYAEIERKERSAMKRLKPKAERDIIKAIRKYGMPRL